MSRIIAEALVGKLLAAHGKTLATAESCTGGLLAHRITNVSGSSAYFLGGVVSYANASKKALLGVPRDILEKHGAVSSACAREMAQGIRRVLRADYGIAITGIAGPGGGTPEKPVGTVYIALATPDGVQDRLKTIKTSRKEFKKAVTDLALEWIVATLRKNS